MAVLRCNFSRVPFICAFEFQVLTGIAVILDVA